MFWYLIVCTLSTGGYGSTDVCLPFQRTASQKQCEFIAAHYRGMGGIERIRTKCIALSNEPTP